MRLKNNADPNATHRDDSFASFSALLGLLLLATGIHKIHNSAALRAVLRFDHLPQPIVPPISWTIVAAEILLGCMLIIWPRRRVLVAAMILLIFYIFQIVYLLIRHNAPNCGCLTGVIEFEDARRAMRSVWREIFSCFWRAGWCGFSNRPNQADNKAMPPTLPAQTSGVIELVIDAQHFRKIVLEGICKASVSVDIMTADFKAMLVPDGITNPRDRSWKFFARWREKASRFACCTRVFPARRH